MKPFSFLTKTTAGILVIALVVPLFLFPRRAEAQLIVHDPINLAAITVGNGAITANLVQANVKTHILDGIAWVVAKAAVQAITKSIVNWINSGFNGSPAFVTDLKSNLLGVADGVVKTYLSQLTINVKINSPFLNSVIRGVAGAYFLATNKDAIVDRLKYTLAEKVQNDRAFLQGNFSEGGFNGWFAASQQPQNNPFGTGLLAQQELNNRIDSEINKRLTELGWGKGFLSWRKCTSYASGGTTALDNSDTCTNEEVQTPGSVIENQLESSLGSGIRQLELADSFNEIVGALAGQLVNQVLGGTGLSGASKASTRDTTSYLDQTTNEAASTTGSLQDSFVKTLDSFKKQLTDFIQNWTTVRTAAQAAKDALLRCGTDNANSLIASEIQPALIEADQHITEATTGLGTTDSIRTRATATVSSNTDAATLYSGLSAEYDTLVGTFSATDFADAAQEASGGAGSLVSRMNDLVSQSNTPRLGCATVR